MRRDSLEGASVSSRIVVALAVLALPIAVSAVSAPAQARGEVLRCEGHQATIVGTGHSDIIQGTEGADVIVGLQGRDVIDGGGGNDLICGGFGRDTIDGGTGNDRIHGNQALDTLSGGAGDDRLFGNLGIATSFYADQGDDTMVSKSTRDSVSYENAPNGVSVDLATGTATGWGTDMFHSIGSMPLTLLGSVYDDTLLGTSGADVIWGKGGEDAIVGRGGDDTLGALGGSIVGGAGDDHLGSESGADIHLGLDLDGGAGNDILESLNPGQDLGGPGDDMLSWNWDTAPLPAGLILDGGEGTDGLDLWGGVAVSHAVTFDMGSNSMTVDSVTATAADFENFRGYFYGTADITGTDGPNSISVYWEGSTIHALGGNDRIHGSNGDDLIYGGPGEDTANGSDGTDTCASVENPSNCEVINP
jgi:hypothetical protein